MQKRSLAIVFPVLLAPLALATEPPQSFSAGGKTFTKSGSGVTRTTTWIPVALIAAPPFERVIPRARLRDEDLVPLSLIPEEVYTSFSQGTGQSGSTSSGMYARVSAAVGVSGEVPFIGEASFMGGIEAALEASCGTSWETSISSTGAIAGYNWMLTDDAMVFAVRSRYTGYNYGAEGVAGKVQIYLPQDGSHTARLYSLEEWNAYAQAKNDAGEYLRDLPTFQCERPLTGNVDQYPTMEKGYYPVNAGDRFRGTPSFKLAGSALYIDHHGSSLSSAMEISASEFQAGEASVGATLEFEAESQGVAVSVAGAVGATFTHEFSNKRSISMAFQTSGVHEKLDGSTYKNVDYHFEVRPRLYGLNITHAPDSDFSRMVARRLSFQLQGAAVKGATRVTHVTGNETNLVRAGAGGQPMFAPTGQPLATVLSANGISSVWDSNVLVFDFVVPEKGVSYGRGVPIMPLLQTLVVNGVLVPAPSEPSHNAWASLGQGLALPDPMVMISSEPRTTWTAQMVEQIQNLNNLVYCGPKPGDLREAREKLTAFEPSQNDWVLVKPPSARTLTVNPALFNPSSPRARPKPGPWLSLPLMSAELVQ